MKNKLLELEEQKLDNEGLIILFKEKEKEIKILNLETIVKMFVKIDIYDKDFKKSQLMEILNLENSLNIKPFNNDLPIGFKECLKYVETDKSNYFKITGDNNLKNPNIINFPIFDNEIYVEIFVYSIKFKKILNQNNRYEYFMKRIYELKEIGKKSFLESNYEKSIKEYEKLLSNLNQIKKNDESDDKKEEDNIMVIIYNNISLCYLKLLDYNKSINYCEKSLKINSCYIGNKKAWYRKATNLHYTKSYEEAELIFKKLGFNKKSNLVKKYRLNYQKKYQKMFNDYKLD